MHVQKLSSVGVASDKSPADTEFEHRRQFCLHELKVFENEIFPKKNLFFSIVHMKKCHILY